MDRLFTSNLIGPKGQNKQEIKLGMTVSGAISPCADAEMQNPTAACEDPLSRTLAHMHAGRHD